MSKIALKKNEEIRIKNGHLWVFSNEIEITEGNPENGDSVFVYDFKNNFLGTGFYNKNSLIAVRMLSKEKIDNFLQFARTKIIDAYALRSALYPERNSFRVIFSESDFMPGLIIDKYNSTFVLQVNSFGIEKNLPDILKILMEDLRAENIFTKNDFHFRKLEGLPESDEVYLGSQTEEIITDGSVNYLIDFKKGQKTGFFFDQSDNRFFIETIAAGKNVLDGFCNSGGFGLHAAKAGSASITFIDSSSFEIESAMENFKINKFDIPVQFIKEDVFDFLERNIGTENKFDIIILDPPAFAKGKKNLQTAKKGYEKLNKLAVQNIKSNGFLVTSSCSYHIKEDEFMKILNTASIKSGKKLQLLYFNNASRDHPRLPAMEETNYLKFGVFRVI
ncbi:MAG TPA: class I SAM-dependent rRNA methyltransferase [Ignavibacteriaceae bacterium]|nr:class I SAM-dependent rRNA methyltransferase [Ignavibacteriaceae bacterium]